MAHMSYLSYPRIPSCAALEAIMLHEAPASPVGGLSAGPISRLKIKVACSAAAVGRKSESGRWF